MTNLFEMLETDRRFYDSPSAGDPACLCSRCGFHIAHTVVPIRVFNEEDDSEYRYHPACVGLQATEFDGFGDDFEEPIFEDKP